MRRVNQQVRGGGAAATGSTPLPGWQIFLTAAAAVAVVCLSLCRCCCCCCLCVAFVCVAAAGG